MNSKESHSTSEKENVTKYELLVDNKEMTLLIWGDDVKQDVFERWSQGFIFNTAKEPTAMIQHNGGPCAIISAVQAFLLKELLYGPNHGEEWHKVSDEELDRHLIDAFLSIFINVSSSDIPKYLVFYDFNDEEKQDDNEASSSSDSTSKRAKLDFEAFTKRLLVFKFDTLNELKAKLSICLNAFKREYGVLCFLYSILLTKGLDLLKKELEECGESLIDPIYGHGSQTLTNLMLCGLATANVFDDEKYLEGLKLQGIPKQASIGFLTIMEYLRYCEVGWNYKNPKYPIWILASETHLTVFFSQVIQYILNSYFKNYLDQIGNIKELSLIQKNDNNRQAAMKIFQKYDPSENGFVKTEDLDKLMESLDLLTDKEYIDAVKQQLDTENLGIITKTAFLNEFYPDSEQNQIPANFVVYHYNGLARSNQDNEVHYSKGTARVLDFTDQPCQDINSIKSCLQTKWPTIEIDWIDTRPPSLN